MKSIINLIGITLCYYLTVKELHISTQIVIFVLMIINALFVGLYLLKKSNNNRL